MQQWNENMGLLDDLDLLLEVAIAGSSDSLCCAYALFDLDDCSIQADVPGAGSMLPLRALGESAKVLALLDV